MDLKNIVETQNSKAGKIFDLFFQFLIILSLVGHALETLPEMEQFHQELFYSELIIVILFTFEYLLRIFVASQKLKFVFSFYGIIDLLAILPFYLLISSTGAFVDFRFLRIVRLLRLFRAFKMVRYSKAIDRLFNAFKEIRAELFVYTLITLFLLYFSAAGIYFFENPAQPEVFKSIFHSLWWAVATLTTVGYGDVYPITIGGKIFTFFVLLIGLGIVSVPSALLASALSRTDK